MALEPLSFADIEAWARLNGEEIRPWEMRCLAAMDGARLAESARQNDPNGAREVSVGDADGVRAMTRALTAKVQHRMSA